MLAGAATDLDDAWERLGGRAAVDWKLDGVRIQVHRDGDDVHVLTRSLDDVTARMPEVVAAVRALPAQRLVLDGEALALGADGRPRPFQETASRAARSSGTTLTPWFFDVLHVDGADLLDAPADRARRARWRRWCRPSSGRRGWSPTTRTRARLPGRGARRRHEGVVLKALDAPVRGGPARRRVAEGQAAAHARPRRAGRRARSGGGAAGCRTCTWARATRRAASSCSGKTFKGLTDELLAWQTDAAARARGQRRRRVVRVRPELVVEIAFDGVQTSPRYPAGRAALRPVLRHREDKTAEQATPSTTAAGCTAA
jgi:DNA ligase-1